MRGRGSHDEDQLVQRPELRMKGVGMSLESHPEGVGGGTPWRWPTVAGQSPHRQKLQGD